MKTSIPLLTHFFGLLVRASVLFGTQKPSTEKPQWLLQEVLCQVVFYRKKGEPNYDHLYQKRKTNECHSLEQITQNYTLTFDQKEICSSRELVNSKVEGVLKEMVLSNIKKDLVDYLNRSIEGKNIGMDAVELYHHMYADKPLSERDLEGKLHPLLQYELFPQAVFYYKIAR